jgi:hypothetical protein
MRFSYLVCQIAYSMNRMKNILLFGLLGGLWLSGCHSPIAPNEDNPALHDRFHGKYKIVSSYTDVPVELNGDGTPTTDLTKELPVTANIHNSGLELRVYRDYKRTMEPVYSFAQNWPEQYIWRPGMVSSQAWNGQPLAYDPAIDVYYLNQAGWYRFSFSPDLTEIIVTGKEDTTGTRWRKPLSVKIIGEHTIELVNKRTLYTRQGTKEVIITTVVERYTIVT